MLTQVTAASETVGERIKRLRLERGMSQRELECPGVSYAYISRIEAGDRRPSVRALRKLAEKLGTTSAYLETGSASVLDAPEYLELLAHAQRMERERDEAIARVKRLQQALSGEAA